jgi:hypothetical protein
VFEFEFEVPIQPDFKILVYIGIWVKKKTAHRISTLLRPCLRIHLTNGEMLIVCSTRSTSVRVIFKINCICIYICKECVVILKVAM